MRGFVADASVAIGWVHPGQATRESDSMLAAIDEGSAFDVPGLWLLEVANALTVLVRRKKLTEQERQIALGWLRALPVRVDHDVASGAFSVLAELASKDQLSVYDAVYLELAKQRKLPLGCGDGPLRKAAAKYGVRLWQ